MFSTNSDHVDIEAVIASLNTGDSSAVKSLWLSYSNNMARHIIAVSRHFQFSLMNMLTEEAGFGGLRLSFEPVIAALARRHASIVQNGVELFDFRPSELANQLGISKQVCNQTINQLEALAYVQRIADPRDGRARLLRLTDRGLSLASEGRNGIYRVATHYAELLNGKVLATSQENNLNELIKQLNTLVDGLDLVAPSQVKPHAIDEQLLGVLLPALSHYFSQQLLTLTQQAGHTAITVAHGQVLALIGLDGGAIQVMASIQNISKQAMSVITNDLEKLGYLSRSEARQSTKTVLFNFTDLGWQLMADSISAISSIENELSKILGVKSFAQLQLALRTLYFSLKLDSELITSTEPTVSTTPEDLAKIVKRHFTSIQVDELIRFLKIEQ